MRIPFFATSCLTVLLGAPAAAAPGPSPSAHVVLQFEDGVLRVRAVRPTERAPTAPEVRRDPRDRIAEGLTPDGAWTGHPVRQEDAAFSLVVPWDSLGTTIAVTLGGAEHPVALPDVFARGDEPVEPEVIEFQISGPPEERQDVVFLADGYTAQERDRFVSDVQTTLDYLATLAPYDRYLPVLNVYGVFLPSVQSGADHLEAEPQTYVDTVLGCHFGAYGIDRLVDCEPGSVLALSASAPGEDVRIVLVNDPGHGGSGGSQYAVATNGPEMVRIVAHEMGHTDGQLADEYDYGYASNGNQTELPNCHWSADGVPWTGWIAVDSPEVGAFEICSFSDYYRPTDTSCAMGALQDQLCVVCREQLVRRIYRLVGSLLVDAAEAPDAPLEPGGQVTLWVEPLPLGGDPVAVTWERDDGTVLGSGPSIEIPADALLDGPNTVTAYLEDTVGFEYVLEDEPAPMTEAVSWTLEVSPGAGGNDDDDAGGDDDDDTGSACSGCGGGDDDDGGGGFGRVGFLVPLMPLLLLGRRRQRA
jgi:hypothetical protein